MRSNPTKIILPSSSPDLDGVACAVAYSEFFRKTGKLAEPWFYGTPDAEALYVLTQCVDVKFADKTTVETASEYILVDASGLESLPKEVNTEQVVEVIDHRLHHDAKKTFPNAALQIEPVGAAATLIAERCRNQDVIPSFDSGILLYGAVHSNTQCLQGSVTTGRDREISAWLESVVSIPRDLLDGQFAARRENIMTNIPAAILRECKEYAHASGDYAIAQLEFKGAGEVLENDLNSLIGYVLEVGPRTMLNLVDVATGRSYLIVPDTSLRTSVSACANLDFVGVIAESSPVILRKQIVAAMKGIPWGS
jgi:inorganic pyrophosphatase/exopolyphosphatase